MVNPVAGPRVGMFLFPMLAEHEFSFGSALIDKKKALVRLIALWA